MMYCFSLLSSAVLVTASSARLNYDVMTICFDQVESWDVKFRC